MNKEQYITRLNDLGINAKICDWSQEGWFCLDIEIIINGQIKHLHTPYELDFIFTELHVTQTPKEIEEIKTYEETK